MLQACHPRKVFLMAGTNGLKDQSLTEFQSIYTQLVDSIHTRLPQSQIFLQSILPVNHEYAEPDMRKGFASNEEILDANKNICKIAKQKHITYIDLHYLYFENGMMAERYTRDGIHLKLEAYQLWADEIHKNT